MIHYLHINVGYHKPLFQVLAGGGSATGFETAAAEAGSSVGVADEAGSSAGADTGSLAGSSAGADTGSLAGSSAGADTGSLAGSSAGADTGSSAGVEAVSSAGAELVSSAAAAGASFAVSAAGAADALGLLLVILFTSFWKNKVIFDFGVDVVVGAGSVAAASTGSGAFSGTAASTGSGAFSGTAASTGAASVLTVSVIGGSMAASLVLTGSVTTGFDTAS
jgi:type IV secretion system protein TrbL